MGPLEQSFRDRAIEARRRLVGRVPVQVIERLALMAARPGVSKPVPAAGCEDPAIIEEESPFEPGETPTPQRSSANIIKEVSLKHGVSVGEIISDIRSVGIVAARHEAMYRIREERRLSWAQIGRLFRRDHTSVLHAWRKQKAKHEAAAQ